MTPTAAAGANLAQALTGCTTAEKKDGMMPPVYQVLDNHNPASPDIELTRFDRLLRKGSHQ
jgi:hypothetical protein